VARERALAAPEHRKVPVAPGVAVDSWLVLPGGDGPAPLVVWLQGGGTQHGWQFSHELQLLVSAGHAVLSLNPRGSAGYGTAWMRTVAGPRAAVPGSGWGGTDVADVVAVLRATLAATPRLDAARVGVMGGSYGGLLTAHLLAQTDLFRAGWAERGPYDLLSDAGTKDEAPWFFQAYLGADHLADRESYWQASPLRLAAGITAPLAIVHSEEDRRCSIGQAEELFMALKLLDREVEFVRFPGEGHELTRSGSPVHRLQRLEILLEWFGRWLTP
jgi:dipeptidyl aminopeptidase/acylaminoacyl peptidase